MSDNLIPEERELADALLLIANKYGKFDDDNTGVWAGYTPASENKDNAKIGVKCGNCVFFNGSNGCAIIASAVEEGGLCRFAVLPDGTVTPEKPKEEVAPVGEDVNVSVEEFFQKPAYSLPDGLKEYAEENEEDYESDINLDE
jgi:hypothetical protein